MVQKESKKDKNKYTFKERYYIMVSFFTMMVLVSWIVSMGVASYKYEQLKYHSYDDDYVWSEIDIPDDVDVYLVRNLKNYKAYPFFVSADYTLGLYNSFSNHVYIEHGLNYEERYITLAHELGHYEWSHVINKSTKQLIKDEYEIDCKDDKSYRCKDANEYYAFKRQNDFVRLKWGI